MTFFTLRDVFCHYVLFPVFGILMVSQNKFSPHIRTLTSYLADPGSFPDWTKFGVTGYGLSTGCFSDHRDELLTVPPLNQSKSCNRSDFSVEMFLATYYGRFHGRAYRIPKLFPNPN